MLSLSTHGAVYTHAHTNYSLSLSIQCPAEVQHFTSTLFQTFTLQSPPPTTLLLPPISRIQHQHTMNVGAEKDREGENHPKIILTHNRVTKEKGV